MVIFQDGQLVNIQDGPPHPVGTDDRPSHYGTYDQAGSLREWLEADNSFDSANTRARGGFYAANGNSYFTASAMVTTEYL